MVAQTLFAEKGFKATTVQDIAKKAKVNVSLVSYHFNGKEGLFRACIEHAASNRLAASESILTPPKSLDEFRVRLEMFTDEMLTYHVEHPEVCAILHRDLHSEMELIGDIFENSLLKAFQKFVIFLTAAQDAGVLAKWMDPLMSAGHYYGAMLHCVKHQDVARKFFGKTIADPAHRREVRDYLIRTTLEGIQK